MNRAYLDQLRIKTEALAESGLFKSERILVSPQGGRIRVAEGANVINLCANNYLGLADNPELIDVAKRALSKYGYGMASVRFICGTQDVHKQLERRISTFLGTDDAILYSSCFDANGGLFETLLEDSDAVISDELNHASIIDGIRLCKARRERYKNNDMQDLEAKLEATKHCHVQMIATDGVFSMDGSAADLRSICKLADRFNALVMVDDSHAVGFVGERGRGTHEQHGVMGRVDIITGTLGKALGGASGGYTAGRKEIVGWLRQRSRPYLFSNTLAPVIAATSIRVIEMLEHSDALRDRLWTNTRYFRNALESLGFDVLPGDHPIIPVMLGDAKLASKMADRLLAEGVYVIAFSYPVVPQGRARIRTQMSAAHERIELDQAIEAFAVVGRELGAIG